MILPEPTKVTSPAATPISDGASMVELDYPSIFAHLTNLQAMFSWPSPAKTLLSPKGTTCLLGYSQTLIDHHFVMAARFSETLENKVLAAVL